MTDMEEGLERQPLGYLLYRVVAALRAEITAVLVPLKLSFPDYICLRVLAADPGQSNAELARATNVTPQSMNTVLQRLQDAALLTRPASVASGRSRPAELTARGAALLHRAESAVAHAEHHVLGGLTPPQRQEFRTTLTLLAAHGGSDVEPRHG